MSDSPRVWSKFSATNKDGVVLNFRIVDLPKDRYDDFVDAYMNYFVKEELTFTSSGVPKCEKAMEQVKYSISKRRNYEKTHNVICCLDNNDDVIQDIIGGSIMTLQTPEKMTEKKDLPAEAAEAVKKVLEVYGGMLSAYDTVKEFNIDKHFVDRGVFVRHDYRGLGIAQELFRVRRLICKEYGVTIHGAWMSSYGTQKAAERDGWETVCEIQYDEYGKKHGVSFENGPPTCKFMMFKLSST